jgi:hypothetical protein
MSISANKLADIGDERSGQSCTRTRTRTRTGAQIVDWYRQVSAFTNLGPYEKRLALELPDDVRELGVLIRKQFIHRVTLANGNTRSNSDCRYGDMTKVPWWRQPEDDNFPTAIAMVAELFRRDDRGFVRDRKEEHKVILTCRFVAILMAAVLKAKGIPARVRSGFDPYTSPKPGTSCDHWITQYWLDGQQRWVTIDADCCLEELKFDPFDIPTGAFDWSADAWLTARSGKVDPQKFWIPDGTNGMMAIAWELFYDIHCLMNQEIIYLHVPKFVSPAEFRKLSSSDLRRIDRLAELLQDPDKNFNRLQEEFGSNRQLRMLTGALLSD